MNRTDRELLEARIDTLEYRVQTLSRMVAMLLAHDDNGLFDEARDLMSETSSQSFRQMNTNLRSAGHDHMLGTLADDLEDAIYRRRRSGTHGQ
ncbi:hypothetical protein [Acetobacter estunensis]|uniref:hypothetical protein n=1 Tax=Acetobacter estunensis TaxID=104097 RepID=UPI001C2DF014|nr:hypothetical protein [Acetobacter estunensis]MBV1835632.1 hypothetical protein [Acetobacter estunensis]MBV1836107.1 hypothetical protein [Acetobacter estunensis]